MAHTKSLLMGAVPGVALALMMVIAIPGAALVGTQTTADSIGPHGYVTVSVVRDGQEIYHYEDHNAVTNAGRELIASRIFDPADTTTLSATNKARYIALASTDQTVDATQESLTGEINTGGLERAEGSYNLSGNQITISNTFAADASFSDVRRAGLFTDETLGEGIMFAINSFTAVSLEENDQLTITWTITLT